MEQHTESVTGGARAGAPARRPALRHAWAALVAGALLVAAGGPRAQAWPSRPVTIVVAYAPGGGSDTVARLIATDLGKRLGQPVVVENRPGAGGNIGTAAVARAAPDGHTLLLTPPGPIINNRLLYKSLPFDPDRDFVPVMRLVESPFAVLVNPALPVRSVQELIAHARANPGAIKVGTVGTGSTGHLLNLMIQHHTGTKFNIVPYKGSAQVIVDLVAGHLDMSIDYPSSYARHIEQNKLRVLATLGATRHEMLPDAPTFIESGIREIEATGWFGLLAPRGTGADVVQRLDREIGEILRGSEIRAKLATIGFTPAVAPAAELERLIASETARLGAIIRQEKLSLD